MFRPKYNQSRLPFIILLCGVLVAVFGLLAIYDASVIDAFRTFGDKFHYVKQQAVWLVIGIFVCIVTSAIPIDIIKKYAHLIYIATFVLMILVLIPGVGSKLLGARRWIIAGPIVIQPSELLKISMVIYLSKWLEKERDLRSFLFFLAVNLGLIMLQPDLGTAIIVMGTGFMVYYFSGASLKEIFTFVSVLGVATCLLIFSSPYRVDRLKTFMDPTSDPQGASYHINQILYGLGSGGVNGVGLGRSRQKYAYLPEATTDSIFVIIAEEFGFWGGSIIIITLVGLLLLAFKVPLKANQKFDKLLSSGVILIFLIQIFVNLGAMTALVPLTGVPLPFISYGGSSLVTNFIALGLLVNISKKI